MLPSCWCIKVCTEANKISDFRLAKSSKLAVWFKFEQQQWVQQSLKLWRSCRYAGKIPATINSNEQRVWPKHVFRRDWLPLNDLLGHVNTILLISHCGANSQFEVRKYRLYNVVYIFIWVNAGSMSFMKSRKQSKMTINDLNLRNQATLNYNSIKRP